MYKFTLINDKWFPPNEFPHCSNKSELIYHWNSLQVTQLIRFFLHKPLKYPKRKEKDLFWHFNNWYYCSFCLKKMCQTTLQKLKYNYWPFPLDLITIMSSLTQWRTHWSSQSRVTKNKPGWLCCHCSVNDCTVQYSSSSQRCGRSSH